MRKNRLSKIVLVGVILAVIALGVFFVVEKFFSQGARLDKEKKELPTPGLSGVGGRAQGDNANAQESSLPTPNTPRPTDLIPEELNLKVPFTPQAPTANWDKTHEEACEEATVFMAGRYFAGRGIDGAADAEEGIQQIIDWENQNLGFFESTTAQETVRVIKGVYGLNAEVKGDQGVEEIKQALAQDKLVLVPAAGRQLGNPFYKAPGPLYHFLLIKGYTSTQFITNDAGTKRGENYPYNFQTILDANHDWNGGNVDEGAKKMIFVSK